MTKTEAKQQIIDIVAREGRTTSQVLQIFKSSDLTQEEFLGAVNQGFVERAKGR